MAILTRSGRTALAIALLSKPIHLAWGAGNPSWDTTPAEEPRTATALVAEAGRRALTEFRYVMNELDWIVDAAGPVPDGTAPEDWIADNAGLIPAGRLITVPTGKYVELDPGEESNEVYVRFQFDYEDGAAPPLTIREVGVFVGTVTKPGLPAGQMYFTPADVVDPGQLLALQYDPATQRRANIRPSYEFVLEL